MAEIGRRGQIPSSRRRTVKRYMKNRDIDKIFFFAIWNSTMYVTLQCF